MDIKLKKSKKIKMLLYRMIATGLLLVTIFSAISGYDAILEVIAGNRAAFTGNVLYLNEFQEYIGKVYNDGMMAFSGVGDDNGYPLEDNGFDSVKEQSTIDFYAAIAENQEDLFYYVYDSNFEETPGEYGNDTHTNFPNPIFSEFDGHLILPEDVILLFYQDGATHTLNSNSVIDLQYTKFPYMPDATKTGDIQFVLAMKTGDSLIGGGPLQIMSDKARSYATELMRLLTSFLLLVIAWLFCMSGAKNFRLFKREISDKPTRILLEVKLVGIAAILLLIWKLGGHPLEGITWPAMFGILVCGMFLYPIIMDLNIYNGTLMTCSIPVIAYRNIIEWSQGKTWRKKLGAYAGISGTAAVLSFLITLILSMRNQSEGTKIISVFVAIGVILTLVSVYYLLQFIREVEVVTGKLTDIRGGRLNNPILKDKQVFLLDTIDDINELENGIENAVEQKSKSDKMRVELITNVSHDLKTPLTSIINYVDLLCEEDLTPAARDYAYALKDKSYKLKSMVQDVFEISKASSGNLPVELKVLDLGKLIRQTLADMEERISSSNLTFKVSIPEQPVYIEGDGDKLYRVFQNLFVNALQYSLEYSRVHVILNLEGEYAKASVKNTSKGELGFDTGEIMERFVRADASRTTEGSGLGLSIVKSFSEACGGDFEIITDADMFTAVLTFPVVKKENKEE